MQKVQSWMRQQLAKQYLGSNISRDCETDQDRGDDWEGKSYICVAVAFMEIESDVHEDQTKNIQHQREVCSLILQVRDLESKKNLQEAPVRCQQMIKVDHGHLLARRHHERKIVEKEPDEKRSTFKFHTIKFVTGDSCKLALFVRINMLFCIRRQLSMLDSNKNMIVNKRG